jgi:DNA mismatch repair protein MutS2
MKSYTTLEFDKILNLVANYSKTSLGKEKVLNLEPLTDLVLVNQELKETEEALKIVTHLQAPPFGGIYNIKLTIEKGVKGALIQPHELNEIVSLLNAIEQIKRFMSNLEVKTPIINQYVDQLEELKDLKKEISRCIDDNGNVRDHASLALKQIRRDIHRKENDVKRKMNHILNDKSKMLTENSIMIRNNRFVLPVKQEYKNSLKGMIHDQSISGQTFFIEPQEVMEINNEISHLKAQENQEIERILKYLGSLVGNDAHLLEINVDVLTHLDFVFSKANYAKELDATLPIFNEEHIIELKQARHPLIPREEVVSNDITFDTGAEVLVITGPNTGGKTVTLKVIGLLTMMGQSGLFIPANEESKLGFYTKVFADIGDKQSIEQSLSTFSSHIHNIIDIVENIDHQSLVLLDEVGGGTDPKEGAALAIAILDYIYEKGATVVATTHYHELKEYSHEYDYVMNASVEFNMDTLKPTYRLLLGVPGHSNAIDISSELGLNSTITGKAKEFIVEHSDDSNKLISKLETELFELKKSQDYYQKLVDEMEQKTREIEKEKQRLEDASVKYIEDAKKESNRLVQDAQKQVDNMLKGLKDSNKAHEFLKQKQEMEKLKHETRELRKKETKEIDLRPGDEVEVLPFEQRGILVKKAGNKAWIVQMGAMQSKVEIDRIIFFQRKSKKKETMAPRRIKKRVSLELDLRGMRVLEALEALDKYIDDLVVARIDRASIIHGHGTGAVREAVRDYLKKNKQVTSFRYGGEGEGGLGVTVIHL